MNRYGNEFGYHNPKRTTALVKKLQAETGLQFTCSSWHNDTTDSLQIINVEDWKLYLGDRSDGTGYQLYYDVETETGDYSEAWSERDGLLSVGRYIENYQSHGRQPDIE